RAAVEGETQALSAVSRPVVEHADPPVPLSSWARRIAALPFSDGDRESAAPFNFGPGVGAAEAFPWARWRRIVGSQDPLDPVASYRLHAGEGATRLGAWDTLLGPPETRAAVASWLRRSRAVRCEPEQVLIAGSVQQMLALLARLLVEPGQRLLVEDPSYTGFHAAFLAEGADLEAIPVDREGLRVDALPERERAAADAPRLVIVTPSHQYPTGVILAMERGVACL